MAHARDYDDTHDAASLVRPFPPLEPFAPPEPFASHVSDEGARAVSNLFVLDEELAELVAEEAPAHRIRQRALEAGMRSLLGDGRIKILKGVTTPDEIAKYAQIEVFDPPEVTKH